MGAQGKDYKFKITKANGLMPLLNRMNYINVGDMLSRHTNNKLKSNSPSG
jgi:hypothetical protein